MEESPTSTLLVSTSEEPPPPSNANDAKFDPTTRIYILCTLIVVGLIGCALAGVWLWAYGRRKSRVNLLMVHVTLSDLLVLCAAVLPQLAWEVAARQWTAGPLACKTLKFTQSFAMIASNYMLVVLSVDRYMAIAFPLRSPPAVWLMTTVAWAAAAAISLPQFLLFHVNEVSPGKAGTLPVVLTPNATMAAAAADNITVCESIWRDQPLWQRRAYMTTIGVVTFYVPCIVLWACYLSIYLIIRARALVDSKPRRKSNKIHLQSTAATTLPRAKIKTMKMAIVIGMAFTLCGLPWHILEMIYSFGSHESVPVQVAAVIGSMAVANSAVNSYVFLLFNVTVKCARRALERCVPCRGPAGEDGQAGGPAHRRRLRDSTFSSAARTTDYTLGTSCGGATPLAAKAATDSVMMSAIHSPARARYH